VCSVIDTVLVLVYGLPYRQIYAAVVVLCIDQTGVIVILKSKACLVLLKNLLKCLLGQTNTHILTEKSLITHGASVLEVHPKLQLWH
jgi:hypothetical protein